MLNKPLLQSQIEDCVSSGFKDIHIAVVDHPISIRRFVGDGARWGASLFNKTLAAVLLALTSPIWVTKGLLRKASGKTFFTKGTSLDLSHIEGTEGFDTIENPSVLSFEKSEGLVSRLPGLIDVVKGRIALVGVRHLRELDGLTYIEDWARQRFDSPVGLFTPMDAEDINEESEEEKIIVENLYVANRSFKQDLNVLVKSIRNLLFSRA